MLLKKLAGLWTLAVLKFLNKMPTATQFHKLDKTIEMLPPSRRMHLIAGAFTLSIFAGLIVGAVGKAMQIAQLKQREVILERQRAARVQELVGQAEIQFRYDTKGK